MPRLPRPKEEMVKALRRHINLLEEYADQAFQQQKPEYAGEVAGKLRLLCVKFGSNEPLLLKLMKELGVDIRITLDLPYPPEKMKPEDRWKAEPMTLETYLGLDAAWIRVSSGDLVRFTKAQYIRAWAEQVGAAHEAGRWTKPFGTLSA